MGVSAFSTTFLTGLFSQLPLLVVSLVGAIVSLARWRAAPAASRWTLVASLLSLLTCVAGPVALGLVTESNLRDGGIAATSLAYYFAGITFVVSVLRAVAIAMLLVAVYVGRGSVPGVGTLPPPTGYPSSPSP